MPYAQSLRPSGRLSFGLVSLVFVAATGLLAAGCGSSSSKTDASRVRIRAPAEVRKFTFRSAVLGRDMPIKVFLPPGYSSSDQRYPVLYMLHGLDPNITENWEWEEYGIFWQAEQRMLSGQLPPFIIALPQGEQSYWIDQYDGPNWSKYVAQDVVSAVDTAYRTLPVPDSRAIGGLSMGADGALQIAMSHPGVFGIVGMHSPALRPMEYAAAYYGDSDHFNAYFPPSQLRAQPEYARRLKLELDAGDSDDWLANTEALHAELDELGIPHVYNRWPGSHDGYYWGFHLPDYLKFYAQSFGLPVRDSGADRTTVSNFAVRFRLRMRPCCQRKSPAISGDQTQGGRRRVRGFISDSRTAFKTKCIS